MARPQERAARPHPDPGVGTFESPLLRSAMNTTHDTTTSRATIDVPLGGFLSWRRILAGAFAAVAIYFLLTMLGLGLGFAAADPSGDQDTLQTIGIGAGITWVVSTLVSLFVGGWIAGASPLYASPRAGMVQGLMVWSLVMIFSLVTFSTVAGRLAGGTANVAGATLQAVGRPIAAAASNIGGAATQAIAQNSDQIASYVKEAMASSRSSQSYATGEDVGVQPAGTGGAQGQPQPAVDRRPSSEETREQLRATREVTTAMTRYFTRGADDTQARQKLVQALEEHTDMSQQEAEEAVREWTESYEAAKQEVAQAADKAQDVAVEGAEKATTAAAHAGIWSFVGWALAAVAAILGGRFGASRHDRDRVDHVHTRTHTTHPTT